MRCAPRTPHSTLQVARVRVLRQHGNPMANANAPEISLRLESGAYKRLGFVLFVFVASFFVLLLVSVPRVSTPLPHAPLFCFFWLVPLLLFVRKREKKKKNKKPRRLY